MPEITISALDSEGGASQSDRVHSTHLTEDDNDSSNDHDKVNCMCISSYPHPLSQQSLAIVSLVLSRFRFPDRI